MLSLLLYAIGWHSYKPAHIQRTGAKALLPLHDTFLTGLFDTSIFTS